MLTDAKRPVSRAPCQTTTTIDAHANQECLMSSTTRHGNKHAKALTRRRLQAKERHKQQQRQAQRDIEALSQALHDVGLPDDLVIEIEGRLRAQKKLLGKIFGLMFPTLFGCRSAYGSRGYAAGTKMGPPVSWV